MKPNYDVFPQMDVGMAQRQVFCGMNKMIQEWKRVIASAGKKAFTLVIECYPGVREEAFLSDLQSTWQAEGDGPSQILLTEELFPDKEVLTQKMQPYLTEDRVFGHWYSGEWTDFMQSEKVRQYQEACKNSLGLTIVFGVAASAVTTGDLLVYLDLKRFEIQLRYRSGMGNYHANTDQEQPFLEKYKRGFFLEWRMSDRQKQRILPQIDYFVDANQEAQCKMIEGETFRLALQEYTKRPFRLVPYFDPGVWGGQWMKETFGLDPNEQNFAWCFDGVPEENSIAFRIGDQVIEAPAIDLVLYQPKQLLGEAVYKQYGAEFPIRFDLLDTMGGQNLSLQVHPLPDYIREQFGMAYTQDESYYILDAKEDSVVYLGLKEGIKKEEMLQDLQEAEEGKKTFPADTYINAFPAKKHDHFLIPAGTCHCSGKNTMVLEISATPYIFTFKLWDWGRLGLDGKPRPIHLKHGANVIQWDRQTNWVREQLVHREQVLREEDGWKEERTGLHALEPIETRRHTIQKKVLFHTNGTVHMLNLVEGRAIVIESPKQAFPPFVVHYVETFLIPATVTEYTIRPEQEGETVMVIEAHIRKAEKDGTDC